MGIFHEITDERYRLRGRHIDVHTDMRSIRTERQSDQSILHVLKAVPMEECNRANTLTMVRGDGVPEPLHLQLLVNVLDLRWCLSS